MAIIYTERSFYKEVKKKNLKFNFSVDISLIYAIIQIVSELDDLPDGEAAEFSPLTNRF